MLRGIRERIICDMYIIIQIIICHTKWISRSKYVFLIYIWDYKQDVFGFFYMLSIVLW